jgi:hypothetical protein
MVTLYGQVLIKQQLSKNRSRAGDLCYESVGQIKKRNTRSETGGFTAQTALPMIRQEIPTDATMTSSIASLCSYDDEFDASESISCQSVSAPFNSPHQIVDSQPVDTSFQQSLSEIHPSHSLQSIKFAASETRVHQSKVLARIGRCNLLDKLFQMEATADMRTILLCFRAFSCRGLV